LVRTNLARAEIQEAGEVKEVKENGTTADESYPVRVGAFYKNRVF